jgi:hypothetical protein
MSATAREVRGQQKVIASRLEQLTRPGTFRNTPEQNSERELLIAESERLKQKLMRMEGKKIDTSAIEARAFWRYLQNGLYASQYFPGISAEDRALLRNGHERRDMGEGLPPTAGAAFPGATAGFIVPAEFADQAEIALKHHSDFWATSKILNTRAGGVLGYPTVNDTSISGSIVYEGVLNASNDVAAMSQVSLGAYKWSSGMVRVSLELVQDGGELFQQTLIDLLMQRIARATTPLFTNGGGMNYMSGSPVVATPQPRGIMLDAVNSGVTPIGGRQRHDSRSDNAARLSRLRQYRGEPGHGVSAAGDLDDAPDNAAGGKGLERQKRPADLDSRHECECARGARQRRVHSRPCRPHQHKHGSARGIKKARGLLRSPAVRHPKPAGRHDSPAT